MLEKFSLSLRQQRLSNIDMGHPFLDSVLKLRVPAKNVLVGITRVTVFDGLSLGTFEPAEHFRDGITITKGGAIKRGSENALGALAEESLDAIGNMQGLGSPIQLKKIGHSLLKVAGLIQNDGAETFKPPLNLYGQKMGKAVYVVRKYHSLHKMTSAGRKVIPEGEVRSVLEKPTLITRARVGLDLTKAPVGKDDGLAQIRLRENYDIGPLFPSHRRAVEITQWHKVTVSEMNDEMQETELETHRGRQTLNLGPGEYKIIATGKS